MGKHKNKLERQKGSRTRLAESIFRTVALMTDLEPKVKDKRPMLDYEKLMELHYKLSKNLLEYIQVNDKIREEETRLRVLQNHLLSNLGASVK